MAEITKHYYTFDAHDVLKEHIILNIRVVGIKKLKFRLVIGRFLLELAAMVIGLDYEIEIDEQT